MKWYLKKHVKYLIYQQMCEKCYFDVVSPNSSNYFYQNNLTFTYYKLVIIIYFVWL